MRRRWIAVGLALLIGLVLWLAWLPMPDATRPEAGDVSPSAPVAMPPTPAEELASAAAGAASAAPSSVATAGSADDDPAARAAAVRDAVGGCGSGRPTALSWASTVAQAAAAVTGKAVDRLAGPSAADPAATAEAEMAALQPRARALVGYLAQGGPLAQAAARVLLETLDEQARGEQAASAAWSAAAGGSPAAVPAVTPSASAADRVTPALLQLARDSGSLPVLRLALSRCLQRRSCGDEAAALLQGWAQREPDNASPWLLLSDQARSRGDLQSADEAMYRASQATRMDPHVLPQLAVLAEPAFDAAGGAAAAALQVMWVGIVMAEPWSESAIVAGRCEQKRLVDTNLAQRCEALARLLVEREGSLLGLSVGRGIGERLGWSAERLARLDDRRQAFQERAFIPVYTADPLDCAAQPQLRQEMLGVARRGEIGHHLARMAAAGQSEATLAAAARARQAAMMAEVREAAAREARPASAPP